MCFPLDVSPTGQGVDHKQVQRELGEVAVQLQDPVMLTAASIRVSWNVSGTYFPSVWGTFGSFGVSKERKIIFHFLSISPFRHLLSSSPNADLNFFQVDRQSQYVQGYRLSYRPSGGMWLLQDINSPSERSTVLTGLLKGTEYEIKIRPYFDEFQGKDSRTLLVRTPEEGNNSGK